MDWVLWTFVDGEIRLENRRMAETSHQKDLLEAVEKDLIEAENIIITPIQKNTAQENPSRKNWHGNGPTRVKRVGIFPIVESSHNP